MAYKYKPEEALQFQTILDIISANIKAKGKCLEPYVNELIKQIIYSHNCHKVTASGNFSYSRKGFGVNDFKMALAFSGFHIFNGFVKFIDIEQRNESEIEAIVEREVLKKNETISELKNELSQLKQKYAVGWIRDPNYEKDKENEENEEDIMDAVTNIDIYEEIEENGWTIKRPKSVSNYDQDPDEFELELRRELQNETFS